MFVTLQGYGGLLLHFIGKESNEIEAREYGQVQSLGDVQMEYVDESERRRVQFDCIETGPLSSPRYPKNWPRGTDRRVA
jgi:hypothetical protein